MLAAVGASAAVILVTVFVVWLIRPSDGAPEITDISDPPTSGVELPDDTSVPSIPAPSIPAPSTPASTTPPASSTAPPAQP